MRAEFQRHSLEADQFLIHQVDDDLNSKSGPFIGAESQRGPRGVSCLHKSSTRAPSVWVAWLRTSIGSQLSGRTGSLVKRAFTISKAVFISSALSGSSGWLAVISTASPACWEGKRHTD